VSAPATKREWREAFEALAVWRAGRGPEAFPHALGIDPGPLADWAAEDAVDSLGMIVREVTENGTEMPAAIAAALATQTQIGIEMGLWLAQTGRVPS
jgi:hypothetical protein